MATAILPRFISTGLVFCLFLLAAGVAKAQEAAPDSSVKEPDPDAFLMAKEFPVAQNLDKISDMIRYPFEELEDESMKQGKAVEGRVLFRVLVGKDGSYVRHVVTRSAHPALTQAAEQHIHKLRFSPAIGLDDKPMLFWLNVPINFKWADFKKSYKAWKKEQRKN